MARRPVLNRRDFLKAGMMAGVGLFVSGVGNVRRVSAGAGSGEILRARRAFTDWIPGGTLDPTSVPKYQMPLIKPPVLPRDGKVKNKMGKNADYYEIAVREFTQPILPPGFPETSVWSYGP